MRREDKNAIIEKLTEQINQANNFYLADIGDMNATVTSKLRRACFKNNIELVVVKNTLLSKAFERSNKNLADLQPVLKQSTSIMFCEVGNAPAKLIKEFRAENKKPLLKGAFVLESIYVGDNQLDSLVNLKSREELIGDVVLMLQSPMMKVISQLNSSKNTIAGVVKTLSERE